MRKRRILILILICLLILGSLTFFGEKGILNLLHLRKEVVRIKEKNLRLEEENQKLKEEVKRLQSDKRYIEEIARKELGMVKEGEIIYRFEDKKGDRQLFDREGHKSVSHENKK
jgi:cell division protein FtsL